MAKRSSALRSRRARFSLETLERRDLLTANTTGAMLFQFSPDAGPQPAWLRQSAEAQGLKVESLPVTNLYRLSGNEAAVNALVAAYQSSAGVSYVEPEHTVSVALDPNDPQYTAGNLYGLNGTNGIRANQAWDVSTGSRSVVVADIDTGVDYRHQDLYQNIWINQQEIPSAIHGALTDVDGDGLITFYDLNQPVNIGPGKITDLNGNGYIDAGDLLNNASGWEDGADSDGNGYVDDLVGWNWVNNTNDPLDDHGHGTHTTGTMAAMGNNGVGVVGVNWNVQVMALKFLDSTGSGSDANGALAIRYAADKGARVSNNSWGDTANSSTLFRAIAYADAHNEVVAAAAGNSGGNNDVAPFYPASFSTGTDDSGNPVTLQNLIAVAATDPSGAKAGFSNYGPTSVDIGAPGVSVLSTFPGNSYGYLSGTSMATPHVAGAIGLILSKEPALTDDQVIARVLSTARPLPSLAGLVVSGGELDISPFRIASSSPTTSSTAVDHVRLTFTRGVQDGSFTTADVVSFTGPGGAIPVTGVVKVNSTTYDVTFASQAAAGTYTLVVGPNILDGAGLAMDQNLNGVRGEVPGDQYTASFQIAPALAVLTSAPSGAVTGAIDHFRLTFNTAVQDGSFTTADVVSLTGPGGAITPTAVNKISSTVYDITFASQAATGTYTLVVGPNILDTSGLPMDQNGNGVRGEVPGDQYTAAANLVPPLQVVSSTPSGTVTGAIDHFRLTFGAAVQDGTFTTADVVTLTGPGGAITPAAVNKISSTVYDVTFASQAAPGTYTLVVGPNILDTNGLAMDQNDNGVPGEVPGDRFTGTATIAAATTVNHFDFGTSTSPVAAGYAQVTEATAYTPALGYGWLSGGIDSRDRLVGDALQRDFDFTRDGTFVADVANGSYTVTLLMGDAAAGHDQMGVFLEGAQVDTVTTPGGSWATRSYTVTVSDGQLTLRLADLGGSDANAVLNALDIAPGSPALRVTASTPSGSVSGPIDHFRLTFSVPVQDGTFTLADVNSLTGPGGAITPTAVNKISPTVYDVTFASQAAGGAYTLVVGPNVLDASGHAMDQNNNGTPGEVPGDQYTATATVLAAGEKHFDFGTSTSPVAAGYTQVTETTVYSSSTGYGWLSGGIDSRDRLVGDALQRDFDFTRDGTFVADVANGSYTVTLLMGDAAAGHDQMGVFLEGAQVDTVTTPGGSWATRSYTVTVSDGQLTLRLADLGGSDANAVLNALDIAPGSPTFQVTTSTPTGEVAGPVDRVTLTFSAAVQDGTFTLADVNSLTGPGGAIPPTAVNKISPTVYEVVFPAQSAGGAYTLVVGPNILNTSGQPMDQNGNGTPGEVPGDQYTASFSLSSSARDHFDFGTADSPVATGFRRVSESTTYNTTLGFGWVSGVIDSRDRLVGDDLQRDFDFTRDGTFAVDILNGTYNVTVQMGDAAAGHDQMGVYLEGALRDTVTTAAGAWATRNYTVTVADGQLTFRLADLGGSDAYAVINSIVIAAA